jgi:hypothetical protein
MFMALVGRSLVVDAAAHMSDAGWSARREKRDERRHPALPHRVPQADLDFRQQVEDLDAPGQGH